MKIRGVTLIELMVSIIVTIIVLSGVGMVLVSTYRTKEMQLDLQKVQESGRLALEIIARDLRGAGFYGCAGGHKLRSHLDDSWTSGLVPIAGYEHGSQTQSWFSGGAGALDGLPMPDTRFMSDALLVTFAQPTQFTVASDTENGNEIVFNFRAVSVVRSIAPGENLIISNCGGADLIQVASVNERRNSISYGTGALSRKEGDKVFRFKTVRYFVGDPGLGVSALFRAENGETPALLIPGVENMQVLYGVDTTPAPGVDVYSSADDVSDWGNVRTISISLLLRTLREYGSDADRNSAEKTRQMLDYTYDISGDNSRVRRRVYTTTFELRNG